MSYCIINKDDDFSSDLCNNLKSGIKEEYSTINPNLVIAVGGDGTILQATHLYPEAIIFGVHTGHLGFFANYGINDLDILIDNINNKSYKIDSLDMLSCDIYLDNKKLEVFALNEITIVSPPRTLRLDVYIDDEFFERFRGTGMCISTPSGSTAYNKSLHGSVVDPSIKCMQLTEIAGINSIAYKTLASPLILGYDRKITLKALNLQEVFITVDHLFYKLTNFKSMDILYKNKTIKMAYNNHESFLKRINRSFIISKE